MSNLPHVAPHIQTIQTGFSMLTMLISNAVTAGVMFGLGWYIRGRGMAGVKIDLDNIKMDIANLKSKLSAPSA